MDLDHFKDVNDTFGHRFGDLLLRAVGTRIRAVLPAQETLARLGGDEFAIMLDAGAPDALRVAEGIRRSLVAPVELEGHAIGISASIGISFFPEHGQTETALLQRADIALRRQGDRRRHDGLRRRPRRPQPRARPMSDGEVPGWLATHPVCHTGTFAQPMTRTTRASRASRPTGCTPRYTSVGYGWPRNGSRPHGHTAPTGP